MRSRYLRPSALSSKPNNACSIPMVSSPDAPGLIVLVADGGIGSSRVRGSPSNDRGADVVARTPVVAGPGVPDGPLATELALARRRGRNTPPAHTTTRR